MARYHHPHATGPELRVAEALDAMGVEYERNIKGLMARPVYTLTQRGTIIAFDTDTAIGRHKGTVQQLPDRFRAKLEASVRKDVRQRRGLRKAGWPVRHMWEGSSETQGKVHRKLSRLYDLSARKVHAMPALDKRSRLT